MSGISTEQLETDLAAQKELVQRLTKGMDAQLIRIKELEEVLHEILFYPYKIGVIQARAVPKVALEKAEEVLKKGCTND